jgi:hypothetical protein
MQHSAALATARELRRVALADNEAVAIEFLIRQP